MSINILCLYKSLAEDVIHKIDREVLDMAPVLIMVRPASLTGVETSRFGIPV